MKKKINIYLLMVLIFIALNQIKSNAQSHSCCAPSSTQQFAMLASEKNFGDAHLSPLPFHYIPVNGKMISFKTTQAIFNNKKIQKHTYF